MFTRVQRRHTERNARTKRNQWLSRRGIHKQLTLRQRLRKERMDLIREAEFWPIRGVMADLRSYESPKQPEARKFKYRKVHPIKGFLCRIFRRTSA